MLGARTLLGASGLPFHTSLFLPFLPAIQAISAAQGHAPMTLPTRRRLRRVPWPRPWRRSTATVQPRSHEEDCRCSAMNKKLRTEWQRAASRLERSEQGRYELGAPGLTTNGAFRASLLGAKSYGHMELDYGSTMCSWHATLDLFCLTLRTGRLDFSHAKVVAEKLILRNLDRPTSASSLQVVPKGSILIL